MDTHRFVVREISKQVQEFYENRRPFRICHGSTHSMTPTMHDPRATVSTSNLKNILDINIVSRLAIVEPCVPMDDLVKKTLKHGLMPPPVVPALPATTVGGAFSSTAGGSLSFKYGFFDRAVNWLEIVLPDGKITRTSRQRNSELLFAMVESLGTIGIITLFQIKLVPAAWHVELAYLSVDSTVEAVNTINKLPQDPETDFVEGLIYGKDASSCAVIVVGKLFALKATRTQTFSTRTIRGLTNTLSRQAVRPNVFQSSTISSATIEVLPALPTLLRADTLEQVDALAGGLCNTFARADLHRSKYAVG